jgi:hypothetical protein
MMFKFLLFLLFSFTSFAVEHSNEGDMTAITNSILDINTHAGSNFKCKICRANVSSFNFKTPSTNKNSKDKGVGVDFE